MPALILEGKGEKANAIFGFMGESMRNEMMKDITATHLTMCIAELKPDCACFVTTAWSLDFEAMNASEALIEAFRSGRIRASQHPDRIEIVNAYCYGERGESEGEALMIGYIQRFKDKGPTIKKWKIISEDVSTEGRFPEAIKEGFKLARGG